MTVVGYARISRDDPSSDRQVDRLRATGCDEVFVDHATGTRQPRPEFAKAIGSLREGDVFVVVNVDRIGRSVAELVGVMATLDALGVAFRSIDEQIDELNAYGRFFFRVTAALARFDEQVGGELHRAETRRRQEARVAQTPKPPVSRRRLDAARQLRAGGASMREAAEHVAVPERVLRRELERDDADRARRQQPD
ncbi:recombinase family protein [Frigoribacterium sp. VKM Ac-2836]|uniref:recombinase family protein n=1 Tax=Frigoribacterium sp. VKM Ac-2836 TaxID=2739014 RepID=UPI001564ADFD|nr:recombinase family protein [Frigoribacterium sp. VKM Ac-2836]